MRTLGLRGDSNNPTISLRERYTFRTCGAQPIVEVLTEVMASFTKTNEELNTRYKNENEEWIYDYPELNTTINSLKTKLAKYYEGVIQPKLFEYELSK